MSGDRRVDMAQIETLAQLVRDQAGAFDERCDLTPEVAEALTTSEVMRVLIPDEYGGLDGTLVDWFEACLPIAVADASAGWIATQGAVQNLMVTSQSPESFARPFAASARMNTAISNRGDTALEALPDGRWRVSGDWSYESGSLSSTYLGGMFRFADESIEARAGLPIVMLSEDEVEIEQTWNPIGMRGTGSNRVTVAGAVVPPDRVMYFLNPKETNFPDHPAGRLGSGLTMISLAVATTMVGIARRALDEATALLGAKPTRTLFGATGGRTIDSPRVHAELARAEAKWSLVHDGFRVALERTWAAAAAEEWPGPKTGAATVLAGASTSQTCLGIVRDVYELCGTSATQAGTPLERCFRDATTISTQGGVAPGQFEGQGAVLYDVGKV